MQIRINTERVREVGRQFLAEGDRLTEIGQELQNAIGSLDTGAWDGRSRARAEPLLDRVRPESEWVKHQLEELGYKLVRVANIFEQEDDTAARNLAGMPWVDFPIQIGILPVTGDRPWWLHILPLPLPFVQIIGIGWSGRWRDFWERFWNWRNGKGWKTDEEIEAEEQAEMERQRQEDEQRRKEEEGEREKEEEEVSPEPPGPTPVPLAPADPKGETCATYAAKRRPDLGTTKDQDGSAENYINVYKDEVFQITDQDTDLRDKIAKGYAIVWKAGVSGANKTHGHVAIVEEVKPGYVKISEAGWDREDPWISIDELKKLYIIP